MNSSSKKKLKGIGGGWITDENFKPTLFTKPQAKALCKKIKKQREQQYTNGFKYKGVAVIEREDYFAISLW